MHPRYSFSPILLTAILKIGKLQAQVQLQVDKQKSSIVQMEESVVNLSDLHDRVPKCVTLKSGRYVMLIKMNTSTVHCLDQACYHHGGPLVLGDIEDMGGGKWIISCPWHAYKIALETGECLYMGLEMENGKLSKIPELKSKGKKQRVHAVRLEDNLVFVTESNNDNEGYVLESDIYAFEEQTIPDKKDKEVKLHAHLK